jgi:murein DD-endopeptidase MepM/ murein hydrolase activator NlpD
MPSNVSKSLNIRSVLRVLGTKKSFFRFAALSLAAVQLPVAALHAETAPASDNAEGASQFHALFMSWKKLDAMNNGVISIPSIQPISKFTFTSSFGVRSDPFRGYAAMHAGIDLASPTGTPIYATADGMVQKAEWWGGYGNMVDIDHGKGIETRYGHMSKIIAHPGQRVMRGDLIGYVGSTGRSTGSHLHYEVRIDGHAVNPIPFLQSAGYLVAVNETKTPGTAVALGGPED